MLLARFCLLEQYLPNGPDHPFAVTMLNHFNKIQTPLKSISRYSSKKSQCLRFQSKGWSNVEFESLWRIWQSEDCTPTQLRQKLDKVELFDEWEEFALFACHYFILVASNSSKSNLPHFANSELHFQADQGAMTDQPMSYIEARSLYIPISQNSSCRRFAAMIDMTQVVGVHGGIGRQNRETSMDIYTPNNSQYSGIKGPPLPQGLACHTITRFYHSQFLLVGGRTSPDKANIDTWHYDGKAWSMKDVLFPGRFRHCAVAVLGKAEADKVESYEEEGILVFGGRTGNGTILDEWAIWQSGRGWRKLKADSKDNISVLPRFGACMLRDIDSNSGWLFGGIGANRLVQSDVWHWTLEENYGVVNLISQSGDFLGVGSNRLNRFGASVAHTYEEHKLNIIVGGIGSNGLLDASADILLIENSCCGSKTLEKKQQFIDVASAIVKNCNLMIGTCIKSISSDEILLLGGGAVCFSFGTYWNKPCVIKLRTGHTNAYENTWRLMTAKEPSNVDCISIDLGHKSEQLESKSNNEELYNSPKNIRRVQITKEEDFLHMIALSRPAIIEKLDIGRCVEKWTDSYLKQAIGAERKVSFRNQFCSRTLFNVPANAKF